MIYKTFIFLTISFNIWAYPFYTFDRNKIKVDPTMMDRYVKPQLQSIIQEYYQSLASLNPVNNNLIGLKDMAFDANHDWRAWYEKCSRQKSNCIDDLSKIKKHQKNIEVQLCKLQNQIFDRTLFTNQYISDAIFLLAGDLDELAKQNAKIIHIIDVLKITSMDGLNPSYQEKIDLMESLISSMHATTDRIFTMLLSTSLKRQYFDIWFFFIRDLERYLAENKGNDLLIDRLEVFNQGWNTFHMLISKGIVNAPHSVISTLSIMHNRWNSVLKILLKGGE